MSGLNASGIAGYEVLDLTGVRVGEISTPGKSWSVCACRKTC